MIEEMEKHKILPSEVKSAKMTGSVLVVGGGIAGMQASLDCANAGYKVYLLEEQRSLLKRDVTSTSKSYHMPTL